MSGRYDIERRMRREAAKAVAAAVCALAMVLLASYLATAGVLWLVCELLGWGWWSWAASAGVWLLLWLVGSCAGRSGR